MRVTSDSFSLNNCTGFLVFDGVNGAGKSTQIQNLLTFLEKHGVSCSSTREPGGTEFGQSVRSLLMNEKQEKLAPLAETFLFAADRAEHVAKKIKPAIDKNEAIVSDRYYYSTLAFQGFGRGLNVETLRQVNEIAIAETRPDLVFLFDLDPAEGLRRAAIRNSEEHDSFEQEAIDFHTRLREGFLTLSESLPEPFAIIDASKPAEAVWGDMLPYIEKWLDTFKGGVHAE
jgi:dTMP kinase